MTDEELVGLAQRASTKAYAPYSNFRVGCAIESTTGEIATGANMENACYRLGVCAEQSALAAAQQLFGLRNIARIAVAGGSDSAICMPCGGCRQAILEAARVSGRDFIVLCGSSNGSALGRYRIGELLPKAFDAESLELRQA